MSDHSVHGHEIHFAPLSLSLSAFILLPHPHTLFTCLCNCSHTTCQQHFTNISGENSAEHWSSGVIHRFIIKSIENDFCKILTVHTMQRTINACTREEEEILIIAYAF